MPLSDRAGAPTVLRMREHEKLSSSFWNKRKNVFWSSLNLNFLIKMTPRNDLAHSPNLSFPALQATNLYLKHLLHDMSVCDTVNSYRDTIFASKGIPCYSNSSLLACPMSVTVSGLVASSPPNYLRACFDVYYQPVPSSELVLYTSVKSKQSCRFRRIPGVLSHRLGHQLPAAGERHSWHRGEER